MPRFETVPMEEALIRSATGKRAKIIREYVSYLERVEEGQAGKIEPEEGESQGAVKRRLTKAAKLIGKSIHTRRGGDAVYFWTVSKADEKPKRARGRPRKIS